MTDNTAEGDSGRGTEGVPFGPVESSSASAARSFVDQFGAVAVQPLHHEGYAASPASIISASPNPEELWEQVHALNATRKIEPRSYDELQADPNPQALEEYVADAAARQSKFRKQAVEARILARVHWTGKYIAQVSEDEANLHDTITTEAGRGAVERYRQLESGQEVQTDERLRTYLEDYYVKASGWDKKLADAQANVDAGEKPPPGAPDDWYEHTLLHAKTRAARERDMAISDFAAVYGSPTGVEAFIYRKSVLESGDWEDRKKAMQAAANPGGILGKTKRIESALARAEASKVKAFQTADAAVADFRSFLG